jgi:thioredoxin reductase
MFEVLIIGGGVSGSCALVLGSAKIKKICKKTSFHSLIKIIISPGLFLITPIDSCRNIGLGFIVTKHSTAIPTLSSCHSNTRRKVLKLKDNLLTLPLQQTKNTYKTKVIVVTIGASNTFFQLKV